MKLYLTTNIDLDLSELPEFFIEPTINKTTDNLKPKFNPFFNQVWGDFDQVRSYAPTSGYDIKCFFTSKTLLKSVGISSHLGMYDMVDRDGIIDFYVGKNKTLDKRAKANGFKTNEAWLIVHETCHGLAQKANKHDSVHEMEEQGRLKELFTELHNDLLKTKIGMLKQVVELLTQLFSLKKKPGLQPLVEEKANAIVKSMELMGHPVRIIEGYRSSERQDELYAQGRTSPGQIVTNAKGGESLHQYGVAIDLVFRKEGYNASNELWETLGMIGESQGFKWGGRWKFIDKPHFEMTFDYNLNDFISGKVDYSKYKVV